MPRRIHRKATAFIDEHANTILFLLSFLMVITAIFAAIGWNQARTAQRRLTNVEAIQQAELLGKNIADVTTCFNAAKNRPRLIVILRGISVELEPDPRQALGDLIDEYEMTTPATADCVALARKSGVDPKPYLKNPPSDAGKPQR